MDESYQQHEEAVRQIQNVDYSTKQPCGALQKVNVIWKNPWGINPETKETLANVMCESWLDPGLDKTNKNS